MYNAFRRHALFERGQSFSVKTFDRSRNGYQVIRLGAGNDFRRASGQALPLPSRVSFSRAPVFSCAHYFQAPATQATLAHPRDFFLRPKKQTCPCYAGAGKVLGITKDFLCLSNSKIYEKEPRYNETSS